ncbi:MAG: restriction endonuclease subunit S [Methyloprofundus sp.]|nr:restriction endonuclease subunit S [Methyloprofundus sp.]
MSWNYVPFNKTLEKVKNTNKIPRKLFLSSGSYPVISQEKDFINGYWNESDDLFKVEKPVVIFGDHTKVIKLVGFDFVMGADGVKVFLPNDKFDSAFFYYFFLSVKLPDLGYARHFKLLTDLVVPCPSIEEQQRIVAILDAAFEQIDQAKANAQQNLQNARDIFDSALNQVFDKDSISGWNMSELSEVTTFIDYRGKTPQKTDSGLRLITAKNIKMGYIKLEPQEFVSPDSYEGWMTRGIPKEGDVLFTTEAPLANVAMLDTSDRVVFAQRVIVLQQNRDVIDGAFLKYALMSKPLQKLIHEKGTGATATGIKASLLKKIKVPFPCLSSQINIVNMLNGLSSSTEELTQIYQQKITALDELKQSLLQQAFSGQLTGAKDVA